MIWLVFAGMTAVALTALVWPLLRPQPAASGLANSEPDKARDRRHAMAVALTAAILAGGALLYLRIGSPRQPDAPLSARTDAHEDFATALARIERHLERDPDDVRGWSVLAPVYLRLGRADDAVRAYRQIVRLKGDTPENLADLAEAQVHRAQGVITAEARAGFEQAAGKDPTLAKAQWYLGLGAEQDGDKAKARKIWEAMVANAPPDSPLAAALRERIAALDGAAPASGIAALPPAERAQAIRGMVESLAARLREKGDDLEGWLRLVRAYRVLGEEEKARQALADARGHFAQNEPAMNRLAALARELGMGG